LAEEFPSGYEAELAEWQAIVARDQHAFNEWHKRYEIRLRRSLRSFADVVDPEAALQEALLRMWQTAPVVKPDGHRAIEPDGPDFLYRWTVTVAHRNALNRLKRSAREDLVGRVELVADVRPRDDNAVGGRTRKRIGEQDTYKERTADPMLRERIGRCANQLTGKLRNALRARIRDEGQRNDSELAAELGTTHDAFRKQIGRFRDAVEQCLLRHGIKFREYFA
jgi:RNA polymerase sigma-70 factor (ECF subfamily)